MNTSRLRRESGLLGRLLFQHRVQHRCPVCRKLHDVPAARAQFAYGSQLTCGPECEAARRRRIRAAYLAMTLRAVGRTRSADCRETPSGFRDERKLPAQPTLRLVSGGEPKVMLSVTVESADVLQVRRAVFESAGGAVDVLKAVPLPHCSKMRMLVSIKAGAVDAIRSAIMHAVPAGEFGRICRA